MSERAAGIDVSHYQRRIDWASVKSSGVGYALMKATEADHFVDPRFDYNWTRARRVGILRGAYHFFRPLVDPVVQANHFLKITGKIYHHTDLPPAVDIEVTPDFVRHEWKQLKLEERLRRIQLWLQTVEAALGKKPMIYTGFYTWFEYLGNSDRFTDYPLWIAAYGVEKPRIPANNWGGNGWTFWQTTGKGAVPGIRGGAPCVDLDVYRGRQADLYQWMGIEKGRSIPPEVTNGDMMAALIDTADAVGGSSDELIARTGLKYLVDPIGNSIRPYDGPAIAELELTGEEKTALETILADYLGSNPAVWRITHQDLINAFYYAASLDGIGGWKLITRAGLDYIGKDRGAIYDGPVIDDLPGLTETQKDAISAALGLIDQQTAEGEGAFGGAPSLDELSEETSEGETGGENEASEEQEDGDGATVLHTYGREVNNQDVINAFYLTAIKFDQNGREMIAAAGLEDLVDHRMEVYTGPRVEDLPGLSDTQRVSIAELMGVDLGDWEPSNPLKEEPTLEEESTDQDEIPTSPPEDEHPDDAVLEVEILPVKEDVGEGNDDEQAGNSEIPEHETPVEERPRPTYPGLINQDVINLIFRVAAAFGENGWEWLVRLGLETIRATRKSRFEDYTGPPLEEISSLTPEQKTIVEKELSLME